MSKNKNTLVCIIILVFTVALGCGYIINPADPKDVADQLLTALRVGDYRRALELLDNDGSKPSEKRIAELKTRIEGGNTQPQSWSLEQRYVDSRNAKSNNSYYVITGTVTYQDGATGTFRIEARAFGLQKNPWRWSGFELKRGSIHNS